MCPIKKGQIYIDLGLLLGLLPALATRLSCLLSMEFQQTIPLKEVWLNFGNFLP